MTPSGHLGSKHCDWLILHFIQIVFLRIVPIYQKTWAKSEPAIKIEYVQQDRRRELKRINHLPQHRRSLQPLPSASRPRTSELHSMTATVPRMEAFGNYY